MVVIMLMLVAMLSIVIVSVWNGIGPMPSSAIVRRTVVEWIRQSGGASPFVVEAGSGWGGLARQIVCLEGSTPQVVGLENSPIPLTLARLLSRHPRLTYQRVNLYDFQYEQADIIVCYLYPGAMKKLAPILQQQLRPGAQVFSIAFALPGWTPSRTIICRDVYRTPIYLYLKE